MSRLSDRLAEAKRELEISNREMESRAKAAGLSLSSYNASVYTSGKHPETPDPQTLEALAYVLRVPLDEVRELADLGPADEPFQPHRSADLLTPPQRTAVNEIIRLLADGNRKAGESGATSTSPMNQAGVRPADEIKARRQLVDEWSFGHPPRGDYGLIADRGESPGKEIDTKFNTLGEEPQIRPEDD